jgi:biopolymer transport protein TolQ
MTNSFFSFLLIQNTGANLNPWDLVLQAGLVVQAVMILLLLASILSWTIIFWKWWLLRNAATQNDAFAESFWASGSLDGALRASKAHPEASLTRVFETGVNEFNQITALELNREQKVELLETNVARSLDKASRVEADKFRMYIPFLANTASAAPFIGLFGTVWGIMNSFIGIGATGASNLAVVAPGIAEALIATAMGLFAAIPAVLFYNFFTSKIKSLSSQMNQFSTDFMNTAKRNL